MGQYRYNDAAAALYRCIWNEFCDWYVEFTKPDHSGRRRGVEGRDPGLYGMGAAASFFISCIPFDALHHRRAVAAALRGGTPAC